MEEDRGILKILTGKPIGKRNPGRPIFGWEDNSRIDLKKSKAQYEEFD